MIKTRLRRLLSNKLLKKGLFDTNYYFLAQVGSRLIGLGVIPIFARLFTVEEFATYDLLILSSSFIVLIAGLGIDSGSAILIAENKAEADALPRILFTTLMLNLITIGILWIVSMGLFYFGIGELSLDISLLHGLFLYTLAYQYNYSVYNFIRWLGNAKVASLVNFFSYVLMVSGGLLAILIFDPSALNYIIGATIGGLIGVLLTTIQARHYLKPGIMPTKGIRELLKLSLPYIPTYMSNYLMQFIDRLLITSFFTLSTLGLYSLVTRIGQIVTFSLQIISSGFRPVITANYTNQHGLALGRMIYNFYCGLTIPYIVFIMLSSSTLINLFGGSEYGQAEPILPFVALSVWFLGSFFLTGYGYQIKRRTLFITLVTLSVVGLIYFLSLIFIRFAGPLGIAQASAISTAAGALFYTHLSERLFSFGYKLKYMWASFVMGEAIVFFAAL